MLATNTTQNSFEAALLGHLYPQEAHGPHPHALLSSRPGDDPFPASALNSAFQYASIGMALVSLDGRFLQANPSLCKIVGYDEQELLATTFQRLMYPDDLATNLGYMQEMLRGAIDYYRLEK